MRRTLLLVFAFAACSDADPHADLVTRQDSAGVEVVTLAHTPGEVPVFASLSAEPVMRLGALDAAPAEQFGQIGDVVPLAGGGIAVADLQAVDVRVFGPDGAYLATVGGPGEGPGELGRVTRVFALGADSLLVYDNRNARLTAYGLDGGLGTVVTLQDARPFRIAWAENTPVLGLVRWTLGGSAMPSSSDAAPRRDTIAAVAFDRDGMPRDTVAVLPDRESIVSVRTAGGDIVSVSVMGLPFSRGAHLAGDPEGVWMGVSDRFELVRTAWDGSYRTVVRAPGLQGPFDPADLEAWRESEMADAETPEEREALEPWIESPVPELRPAFSEFLLDDRGRLWVAQWSFPGEPPASWWVFGGDGTLLGSVAMPEGFRLEAVRDDRVVGVVRDALDVPGVAEYRLELAR